MSEYHSAKKALAARHLKSSALTTAITPQNQSLRVKFGSGARLMRYHGGGQPLAVTRLIIEGLPCSPLWPRDVSPPAARPRPHIPLSGLSVGCSKRPIACLPPHRDLDYRLLTHQRGA
jgi:hypothetical protein